jgi:hypothetical protein
MGILSFLVASVRLSAERAADTFLRAS